MLKRQVFIGALGVLLLALIIWASMNSGSLHGSIFDQGGVIMSLPWGIVAMADLYIGFAIFSVVIFLSEKTWTRGLLWSLPLFVLGNVWAAFWLVLRLPSLVRRINRPDWPDEGTP
jgi:hypothetical protein